MKSLYKHIAELETAIVAMQGEYHEAEERDDWTYSEVIVYNLMLAEKDLIRCKQLKELRK